MAIDNVVTFPDAPQQTSFEFGCRLRPLPHVQSPGHRISEFVEHSEDHCAYVVTWPEYPHLGRCLVIQETAMCHVHIRLRADVSNEEALRHAQALLQAIATPGDGKTTSSGCR
jgi:hypothetical protein